MNSSQEKLTLKIAAASYPLLALTGTEALSTIFSFTLEILAPADFDVGDMLMAQTLLTIVDRGGQSCQRAGLATHVREVGFHDDGRKIIELTCESGLARLRTSTDTRIILGQSLEDIIRELLESNGFAAHQIRFAFSKVPSLKPYRLQVMESHYDFLCRQLAGEGVFFWSDVVDDEEVVTFSDSNNFLPSLGAGYVTYLPPGGLDKGETGMEGLCAHERLIPQCFQVHDVYEQTPGVPIKAEAQTVTGRSEKPLPVSRQTHFGSGATNVDEAEFTAKIMCERAKVESNWLVGTANISGLKAGVLFDLDADDFHSDYSGGYLVTQIDHRANRYAGEGVAGKESFPYQNNATMIRRETPFRPDPPPLKKLPQTFTARVESNGEYARLDAQGRYQIRTLFDQSDRRHSEASTPIRRLTPYGGPMSHEHEVGIHLPLLDGAEVLLSCLNNDLNRPMIVGSLPEPDHQSPVTSQNFSQNILRTMADNELLMDDLKDKQVISLRTFGGQNILELNADVQDQRIRFACEQGAVEEKAGKTMLVEAGDTITEHIGDDRVHTVEQHHETRTTNGEIHHQAHTDHLLKAGKNIHLEAGSNIESTTGKNLLIQVEDNVSLTVNGAEASFTVENGDVHIQAANAISITGDGGGDITFGQAGGGFTITPAGDVNLFGTSISTGNGSDVSLNGNVNYTMGAGAAMADPAPLAPIVPIDIAELVDNSLAQVVNLAWSANRAPITEKTDAMFTVKNFQGGETATVTVYETTPDGTRSAIDALTTTLDDGFGHYAIAWQRTEEEGESLLTEATEEQELDTYKYTFEVDVDGTKEDEPAPPLLLTQQVVVNAKMDDNKPFPEDSAVILTSGDKKRHYGYTKQGQVVFDDIVLGTKTIILPAYLHKG